MIDAEIQRDKVAKSRYYGNDGDRQHDAAPVVAHTEKSAEPLRELGFVARIIQWIFVDK
jgi:hypothetical protein